MRIPKNSTIIRTIAVDEDKVVMVIKSRCRHYSALTFQIQKTDKGDALVMVDRDYRCGMKSCAGKLFEVSK